ncbi:hypothetical protein Dimus_022525, partial [Dionaea muscipula]
AQSWLFMQSCGLPLWQASHHPRRGVGLLCMLSVRLSSAVLPHSAILSSSVKEEGELDIGLILGRFSSSACCYSISAGRGGARPPSHELGLLASSMSSASCPRARALGFRARPLGHAKRRSSGEELSSVVDELGEERSSTFGLEFGEVSSSAHGLSSTLSLTSAYCYPRHAPLKWKFGLTLFSAIAQVWEKPELGSYLCSSWAWGGRARLFCKSFMSSASMHGLPELGLDGCSASHGCDWPS